MTTCSRCRKTLQWYTDRFERELHDANHEYLRLKELYKDTCWYNFEVACRGWNSPWRLTDAESNVGLTAHRYVQYWNKGRLCESSSYPMYYEGTVSNAPPLPPQIVLNELNLAAAYLRHCRDQVHAATDWAPGGKKYEALRKETLVGRWPFSSGVVNGGAADAAWAS